MKFFRLKEHFFKKIKLNINTLKALFLKKNIRKKKLIQFFQFLNKNKQFNKTSLQTNVFINLYISQLFFHKDDINFFLKKGLIYLNGKTLTNKLYNLQPGDRVQLVYSQVYYLYVKKIFKFFKKRIKYIRYKR